MDRRQFLRTGGLLGAGAALGPGMLAGCVPPSPGSGGMEYVPKGIPGGSMLDLAASESPIDHVVFLMMENRSFDHYLGWLATDEGYLERGRRNYGAGFSVDGAQHQTYAAPDGRMVDTISMTGGTSQLGWRGCGFEDPGHGWGQGRAQRDGGFLADGSGNDELALGFLSEPDLPFHARMAHRFTTFDRYHCSLLGPTQPNRRYLHSAQSGGYKNNYIPIAELGHQWPTIWDRLTAAGVSCRTYSPDLPSVAFWGLRMAPLFNPIDRFFEDCAAGTLPAVSYIDPPFLPWWQADDHPLCDPAAGQRFLRDVFSAFTRSPNWERGLFVLTYDEWGGFFDHVAPPRLPDLLASANDEDDFGQAGFRVPTILASPYAKPGYVDHRTYDHTSIMRFIEWRFLGAPPEGPGGSGWWLTPRDRYANNIGASLGATDPDPELFDLDIPLRSPTDLCNGVPQAAAPGMREYVPGTAPTTAAAAAADPEVGGPGVDMLDALESGYFERVGASTEFSSMAGTWVAATS